MNKKKYILFVLEYLGEGGVEKVLQTILDNINYSKYNIDLLVLYGGGYLHDKINKNVKIITLYNTKHDFDIALVNHSYDNALHSLLTPKYDIQIGFIQGFSTIVANYYGNYHAKKIAWIHGETEMIKYLLLSLRNDYYSMNKIVLLSEYGLNSFIELMGKEFKNKCTVINNPVDIDFIIEQSKEPINYTKDKLAVLAAGRLSHEKGFDKLISVHSKLISDGIDHNLIILGEGGDRVKLNNLASQLNVTSSVHLIGFKSNPYPWIAISDILVSSSEYESYSLVLAESMILQKPIVSTMTMGAKELLKYKYGLLVENTEMGLYQGLKTMLTSDYIRNHYTTCLKDTPIHSKEYTLNQIEHLFDE